MLTEPFHGKSCGTGLRVRVMRIQPLPVMSPIRNGGEVWFWQPGIIVKPTFCTAHSYTHTGPVGVSQMKLSFQSPSSFMSMQMLRKPSIGTVPQLVVAKLMDVTSQVLKNTVVGLRRPAS